MKFAVTLFLCALFHLSMSNPIPSSLFDDGPSSSKLQLRDLFSKDVLAPTPTIQRAAQAVDGSIPPPAGQGIGSKVARINTGGWGGSKGFEKRGAGPEPFHSEFAELENIRGFAEREIAAPSSTPDICPPNNYKRCVGS
ncbi:hypothetical protein K491DRAFT_686803 [Lophiostoma macrostomum CBS 122681]|uniref:Uncharacterized protein n=1 Tax=Lophiostoma macrostomum CBS 122681 TaxID=1314788 RepID=A0A6A6TQH7_9PLEO|nr:hypothetical protein K491DRAFT_686803 [Lophiostoma macrostomum CBS 122681]